MKLSELTPSESITGLIYGASGTGKTFFAGTAGSRSAIINIGNGIETLLAKDFKARYGSSNPDIITISESQDSTGYLKSATAFDNVCREIDKLLEREDIDTVTVDDCTALRYYAMNKALILNSDINMSQSLQTSRKYKSRIVAVQDYGREMALIEEFISTYTEIFKQAKKNLLLIAHERILYRKAKNIGDEPTVARILPGFTGQKFPDTVPAYFDCVWRSTVKKSGKAIYEIKTVPDGISTIKTRQGGSLPETITDPNFLTIWSMLKQTNNTEKK